MNWARICALINKEFLAVWHDKKTRFVLVVPPIMQLLVFAFAATLDVENASIGILNRDTGKYSFELIQRFHGSPTFSNIVYLDQIGQIKDVIDTQKVVLVLQFDEQYSRDVLAGKSPSIQAVLDGRKSNTSQIVLGYVQTIMQQYNADIARELGFPRQNSQVIVRNWFNPNLIYNWFTIAGLVAILTMVTGLSVTAQSIARERELGTFDQLLVSPILPLEILLGKMLPGMIIGVFEGTIILLAGVYVFGVPFEGSIWLLYVGMLIFVASIVGVGLFISSMSMTQQQAILGTFVFMAPAVSLSGFATPIENMPWWLQPLTMANPLRHFLVITRGILMRGMPPSAVLENCIPLLVIAAVTLTAATLLFRRRLA